MANIKKQLSVEQLEARAAAYIAAGTPTEAVKIYRSWIKEARSPFAYLVQCQLGALLNSLGDIAGAVGALKAAITQKPGFVTGRFNYAVYLERSGALSDAIKQWQHVINVLGSNQSGTLPMLLSSLNSCALAHERLRNFSAAEDLLAKSLALQADQSGVLYHWIRLRQRQCAWPIYKQIPGLDEEAMYRATSAVAMLSVTDDPAQQLKSALDYVNTKVHAHSPGLAPASGYAHDRLRIAYLSSNLGMHAVSSLTAELFELHDRSKVEVFAFCWSPEDGSPMRERVCRAIDHLVRIESLSDAEAAQRILAAEIDILVDLQGLTTGARPNILAYHAAPIQIAYLGYPGTTGMPAIDYVIADSYVLPDAGLPYFTEKPLYMSACFQVNDRTRTASKSMRRQDYGLPDEGFIFCSFNNSTKLTPELFEVWMRILLAVPKSALWLIADNDRARFNLLASAKQQGIAAERVIFAERVQPEDYLSRFEVADLFLDSFPFNGGTTVSDALWMGLPVLSFSGRAFASRMGGSLLHAIGLSELITTSFQAYEVRAIELATDPELVTKYRQRIIAGRNTSSLFDTPRFVTELENIFEKIAIRATAPPMALTPCAKDTDGLPRHPAH